MDRPVYIAHIPHDPFFDVFSRTLPRSTLTRYSELYPLPSNPGSLTYATVPPATIGLNHHHHPTTFTPNSAFDLRTMAPNRWYSRYFPVEFS